MSCKKIALFDIDGTITEHRDTISTEMKSFLHSLHEKIDIGFVGGASHEVHMLQLTPEVAEEAEFLFSQNGGETYKHNVLSQKTLLTSLYSDKELNSFISYVLFYLSQLDIPVKRGTFVEFRSSLINICPVGRNASCEERLAFAEYDREHHVREKMINDLQQRFSHLHFTYLIGGLTSFDVVPEGMDKTFCLQYLTDYDTIYFFGDKTNKGGNDYEIYVDPRTIGYSVTCPKDTKAICEKLFLH